ncbi:MAG: PilZ domain-containing protein [Phycisphaerales bacterium]
MHKRKPKPSSSRANALRVFRDAGDEISRVLDELEEDADQSSGAKRSARRQRFRELECLVDIRHAAGGAATSCIVPTRDLSKTGISFLHRSYLHTGARVSVHLRDRSGAMHTCEATVMRCHYLQGMIHETGAKFDKPIELERFVELEPLRIVMLFEDNDAAQVANHQFMCVGAESVLVQSPEELLEQLGKREFDAVVFQGQLVTEDLIKQIRSNGFARSIVAVASEDDEAALKDRADRVFIGPVSPQVASQVVSHLRAA